MILEATHIHKAYVQGRARLEVLRGVDLEVHEGEFVAIVGPSGAGKSTLLHIVGGLDRPTRGAVCIGGQDVYRLPDVPRAHVRNSTIGFVFQFYHLLPEFTAIENVMLPAMMQRGQRRDVLRRRAAVRLEEVGLGHRLQHRPHELSGGELQRAAIARALMNDPALLLCDEPTGNLDTATGDAIMDLLAQLRDAGKRAVVMVSHNEAHARCADRTIHMSDGLIVLGKTREPRQAQR